MAVYNNLYCSIEKFSTEPQKAASMRSETIDTNSLDSNEILVEMKMACVHPADLLTLQGVYPGHKAVKTKKLPSKVGIEGVGRIVYLGDAVKHLAVNDLVRPLFQNGEYAAWQKYAVCRYCTKVPEEIPLEAASQMLVNPCTVFGMFESFGKVKEAEYFVQNAANSACGRIAIQYARSLGLQTISIVRKQEAVKEMLDFGTDYCIASEAESVKDKVMEITRGKGANYAIECVGGESGTELVEIMDFKGKLIIYGLLSNQPIKLDSSKMIFSMITIEGFWLSGFLSVLENIKKATDTMMRLYERGKLTLPVEKVYEFQDIMAALENQHFPKKSRTGKILIKF